MFYLGSSNLKRGESEIVVFNSIEVKYRLPITIFPITIIRGFWPRVIGHNNISLFSLDEIFAKLFQQTPLDV